MSTYLPTIKQLQYLVALYEHGHFGRAADASFVSQSTLSAGIRELESLLGVTLVERSRRVVRFTSLGEQVVAKANRLLGRPGLSADQTLRTAIVKQMTASATRTSPFIWRTRIRTAGFVASVFRRRRRASRRWPAASGC